MKLLVAYLCYFSFTKSSLEDTKQLVKALFSCKKIQSRVTALVKLLPLSTRNHVNQNNLSAGLTSINVPRAIFFSSWSLIDLLKRNHTLHCMKCPYSELSWFVFSGIRISPYSVRMRENKEQNNSEYGHFLRSASYSGVLIDYLSPFSHNFKKHVTALLEMWN